MIKFNDRIGEERVMNNGQKAKIVIYRNANDMDIEFEDGTLLIHRRYEKFKNGQISNPKYNPNSKLGEERIMNNGQKAKIIVYRKADDIDVEFEDGTIVEHTYYHSFKKGEISNPNYNPRVGEERIMNNGQKAKIVCYRSASDIDIKFEDETIVEHKQYVSFKNGNISNPNYRVLIDRFGEERIMNNGQKAKIIVSNGCNDITVEFEDGTIVKNKEYSKFIKGFIANPNYNNYEIRLGEERVMKNGQKAKIVVYRSATDIDIEFEDGTVVKHKCYGNFQRGRISNPNYQPYENIIGEERVMNNGQKAKVVAYRKRYDIDIEFEDSTVVEHKDYSAFKKGNITNPNLVKGGKVGSYRIIKKWCTHRDEKTGEVRYALWECKCEKCGEERLIKPQMMLKHTC